LALCLAVALPFLVAAAHAEAVREERTLTVDGHSETWRLVWTTPTVPACPVEDLDVSITCPCEGFAYGEAGTLNLVRLQSGNEIDRLDLTAAFNLAEGTWLKDPPGNAVLQLRPLRAGADFDQKTDAHSGRPSEAFIAAVKSRPITTIMAFRDFDHTGQATNFLLQVGAGPCGHTAWVAVGLSAGGSKLHLITSVENPRQPLVLPRDAWAALLESSNPPPIQTLGCGDHGSDKEANVELHERGGHISAQKLTYACVGPHNETPGELISRAPW
jgi:hypothetical protein